LKPFAINPLFEGEPGPVVNVELVVRGLQKRHDFSVKSAYVSDELGVVFVRKGLQSLLDLQVVPVRVFLNVCRLAVFEQLQHL
jgi:hypothetical protein